MEGTWWVNVYTTGFSRHSSETNADDADYKRSYTFGDRCLYRLKVTLKEKR